MRTNKVIIFTRQDKIAEVLDSTVKNLDSLGFFNFTYIACPDFDEYVELCQEMRKKTVNSIVAICDNDKLDELLEKVRQEGDELSLMFEQAVKLKNGDKKHLFMPSEVDSFEFLKEFFGQRDMFACNVFGKSFGYVKSCFEMFKATEDIDYKIITESPFLHTVYYSNMLDIEKLNAAFGEGLYSMKNHSLAFTCGALLREKNLSISIAEQITSGTISAKLRLEGEAEIKNSHVLFSNENLERYGIERSLLEEKGVVSKEVAFALAKNLLKKGVSDIALAVVGSDTNGGRCFVAVGNKETLHVYSSVFEGDRKSVLENIQDFALFRLLRFLK